LARKVVGEVCFLDKDLFMGAHAALANKLSRAAYYIMRDRVPYEEAKLFG
jgi:hypothetical protein